MTLNPDEIAITKVQITNSLKSGMEYIGDLYEAPGYKPGMKSWFSHPTAGVVGGFDYTVDQQDDNVICHCVDTWDFNPANERLYFQVSNHIVPVLKTLIRSLGLNSVVKYEEQSGQTKVSVKEVDLMFLNDSHKFVTKWDVVFSKEDWDVLNQSSDFASYYEEDEDEDEDEDLDF